jgi:tetratricopeptide (TPR) repeat protein
MHRRITIYGLGGCGKSALAIEFAYRAMSQQTGRLVFWVPAISRESFELAYKELGVRLRVPGIADDNANIKQLVKDALDSNISYEWLMIVDNADDPKVLMSSANADARVARLIDYLPKSDRGKIVFTTRSKKAAGDLTQSSKLELKDMGEAGARQLLLRRITKQALLDDTNAINELLELLTYLPLAIIQATAFIDNNDMAVSKYISLIRNAGNKVELFGEHFEDPNRYQEMDSTIAKTWHISFDKIREQDALAAEYLSFMACIDRINIPQSLLPPGGSQVQQAKAIGTLKGYAFVTERQQVIPGSASEVFFDVHRLVHMAVAWWLNGQDEQKAWVAKAAARLEELVPCGGHKNKDIWTRYLSHANHVAGLESILDDETRESLLHRVGRCQASLGRYSAAEIAHRQVLSIREMRPEIEDELILLSMNEIGVTLESQGKYTEAETMHRQTLAMSEKVLGVEHPFALTMMNNLAFVLGRQGKDTEAETMHRQTLVMHKKVLGVEHPDTLTTMNTLAIVLDSQGKYTEAETMHRQTLVMHKKVLGVEHPDTLTTMNTLAIVLDSQGKYTEAETMYRQTLVMRKKVLGVKHPSTLTTMNNLAVVLDSQGKYIEAKTMHRQTLAMNEKVLGVEHPSTLTTMNNLALVLDSQGKYTEAETMHRQTLAMSEKVLGVEHPDTLLTMNNLAGVLDSQGKYTEAETMYRQTLVMRKKVLGVEHPDTLMTMNDLAVVLDSEGKYEEAIILSDRTCSGLAKVLGQGHPHTRACYENYSNMLASQRQSRSGSVTDGLNVGANVRRDRASLLSRVARRLRAKSSKF